MGFVFNKWLLEISLWFIFYESFIPMRIIQINRKTRSFLAMKLNHFDMVPYQLHRASLMDTHR